MLRVLEFREFFEPLHLFIEGREREFGLAEVFEDFLGLRELVFLARIGVPVAPEFDLVEFSFRVFSDLGYEGLMDFDVDFGSESEEVGIRFGECHILEWVMRLAQVFYKKRLRCR